MDSLRQSAYCFPIELLAVCLLTSGLVPQVWREVTMFFGPFSFFCTNCEGSSFWTTGHYYFEVLICLDCGFNSLHIKRNYPNFERVQPNICLRLLPSSIQMGFIWKLVFQGLNHALYRVQMQAVRDLCEIVPTRSWRLGERQRTQIVFIGVSCFQLVSSILMFNCCICVVSLPFIVNCVLCFQYWKWFC